MFWHWLVFNGIGGRTVDEAKENMTSHEFSRWLAIFESRPWGFDVDNWRMGQICSTVANYSGLLKKERDFKKPSDFYKR